MSRGTLVLGVLLAASLVCNAVAIVRLSRKPSAASKVGTPEPPEREPDRPGVVAPPAPPPPVTSAPPPPSAPRPPTPYVSDPQVLAVMEAQEAYRALWRELDRVFKARSRLEEAKFLETVVAATADYLQIPDTSRVPFANAAREASLAVAEARKERDAARATLPPKDHVDYQKQRDAIDTRYDGRVNTAIDGLKTPLDGARPRHGEFIANADKWIRAVAPR